MADYTDKLNLFKWDTTDTTDLASTFDIDKTLNDNWDKIDGAFEEIPDTIAEAIEDKADKTDIPTATGDLTNNSGFIDNTVSTLSNYYKKSETYTQEEIDTAISDTKSELEEEISAKANTADVPTTTSALTNDSGFIDNTVDDLENYYTKTETYTQEEIDEKIVDEVVIDSTEPTDDNWKIFIDESEEDTEYEETANKVTEITDDVTDEQYASALATKTYVDKRDWELIGEYTLEEAKMNWLIEFEHEYKQIKSFLNFVASDEDATRPGELMYYVNNSSGSYFSTGMGINVATAYISIFEAEVFVDTIYCKESHGNTSYREYFSYAPTATSITSLKLRTYSGLMTVGSTVKIYGRRA